MGMGIFYFSESGGIVQHRAWFGGAVAYLVCKPVGTNVLLSQWDYFLPHFSQVSDVRSTDSGGGFGYVPSLQMMHLSV